MQDIYGSDSEDMAVERHALSLRFAHDNNQDYITCPLARLVRDVQGNWTQDESYIPPLLAFNAHDGLVQRLDTLLLQLRAKCQRLMAMRRESNQRMADFAVADVSLFWLLNALNSAEPVLSDFLRYPAVHPELVWRELARLAGALLTFSLEHNVSAVPPYVHESPSTVFPPPVLPAQRAAGSQPAVTGDRAGSGVPAGQPLESRPARSAPAGRGRFFICPFVPHCLRIRYCISYRWSAKSVRPMTSRCLSTWR